MDDQTTRRKTPALDKGYAWVVCATTFAFEIIISVIFKTFGVLHIQLKELFGHGSFRTSLVPFTMSLCWVIFSPLGGYLAFKFPRSIIIIVAAMFSTGKVYTAISIFMILWEP